MTYGLIGEKLSHSYSKQIHELLGKYEYDLLPMAENQVASFINERRFKGLNVTIPYKKAVMPLCDVLSPAALEIGAVNTLYFDRENRLCGTNTDYDGFLYMADRARIFFPGKKILILGDGGASLAVGRAVINRGAREVLIASRKAQALGPESVMDGENADNTVKVISYDNLSACADVDVVINTTPVGTYPANGQFLLDLSLFPGCIGVLDLIYNPFVTDLLFQAKERGISYSNGLPMLVAQATKAAELFLSADEGRFQKENEIILKTLEKQLTNLVLIGMPGAGKTTVGKALALRLNKEFIDLDEAVVQEAELSIPEIFHRFGETAFRDMETALARELGKQRGKVIATGGGVVLKQENMAYLKQNGTVIFLKRPLDALATEGRPLSKDMYALKNMYDIRLPLYNKYSDYIIEGSDSVSQNTDAIITALD